MVYNLRIADYDKVTKSINRLRIDHWDYLVCMGKDKASAEQGDESSDIGRENRIDG